jgi:hypothetical protein
MFLHFSAVAGFGGDCASYLGGITEPAKLRIEFVVHLLSLIEKI